MAAQGGGELAAAPSNTALHGTDGHIEHLGDLRVVEVGDVAQHHWEAELVGQGEQGGLDRLAVAEALGGGFRGSVAMRVGRLGVAVLVVVVAVIADRELEAVYSERRIWSASPFAVLDTDGVGALIASAIENARNVNPQIPIGACGEQCADPASARWLVEAGVDSLSCSAPALVGLHAALAGEAPR